MDRADDEDAYVSAEDEDFNPEVNEAASEESSADNEPARLPSSKRRKLAHGNNDDEDVDFNNSGDEATIQKAKRKKQNGSAEDEDEGGDGGLIKTRAQRQAEQSKARDAPRLKASSLDVNSLWAQMSTGVSKPTEVNPGEAPTDRSSKTLGEQDAGTVADPNPLDKLGKKSGPEPPPESTNQDTVTITRTYDFAGETITERRVVAKDSAEAKLYIQQQEQAAATAAAAKSGAAATTTTAQSKPPLRRPMRKSLLPGAGDSDASAAKAKKLNTVEKSRLDWAKLVDEEGLGEELDGHRKAKDTYLGRMDFLDRMGARDDHTRRGNGNGK